MFNLGFINVKYPRKKMATWQVINEHHEFVDHLRNLHWYDLQNVNLAETN